MAAFWKAYDTAWTRATTLNLALLDEMASTKEIPWPFCFTDKGLREREFLDDAYQNAHQFWQNIIIEVREEAIGVLAKIF